MIEKRRTITNDTDRLMLVWTEPLAEDYWLRPGESLEVVANARAAHDEFEIENNDDGLTVFASMGMTPFFDVFQNGVKLECGHQRREGWA